MTKCTTTNAQEQQPGGKTVKNKKNKKSKDASKSGEKLKIGGEKNLSLKNTHQELITKNE